MVGVQFKTNPGLARCESCGHEVGYLFDKAIPPELFSECSDVVLLLDDAGPNLVAVANAIRPLSGLTSRAALALVRLPHVEVVRRENWRASELEELQQKLHSLGAKTRLKRVSARRR